MRNRTEYARSAKIDPAAAPDQVELIDRLEMEGLLTLQRSRFWLNGFIGELLGEFADGKRVQPQEVVLALSDSIGGIESTIAGSEARKAITGEDLRPMRITRKPGADRKTKVQGSTAAEASGSRPYVRDVRRHGRRCRGRPAPRRSGGLEYQPTCLRSYGRGPERFAEALHLVRARILPGTKGGNEMTQNEVIETVIEQLDLIAQNLIEREECTDEAKLLKSIAKMLKKTLKT